VPCLSTSSCRFDVKPGQLDSLRNEFIPSTAKDEGAFDAHAQFPHTKRFLGLLGDLLTNPVKAVRTRQID
jgi:hypothetical protein